MGTEEKHDCKDDSGIYFDETNKFVKFDKVVMFKGVCRKCGKVGYKLYDSYQLVMEDEKNDYDMPFF